MLCYVCLNSDEKNVYDCVLDIWEFWKLYLSWFDFVMKHHNWYTIIALVT